MRRIAVVLIAFLASLSCSLPAYACETCTPILTPTPSPFGGSVDVNVPGSGGGTGTGTGAGSGSSSFGSGGGHPLSCRTFSTGGAQDGSDGASPELNIGGIAVGTLVYQVCVDGVTGEVIAGAPFIWTGSAPAAPISPVVLARHARAQLVLPLPSIRTWPSPDNQVVRVATWLRADNFIADTRTATAGAVSATVTATPVEARWTMGDGAVVSCVTAGAALDNPNTALPTDCSHTFEHSSGRTADGRFHGSVSITWHLTWTSNVGAGGDLGFVTRTVGLAWRVEQIQSLITSEGRP